MKVLHIFAASDVGLRRGRNEDMALLGNDFLRDAEYEGIAELNGATDRYFAAVADGMGGHNAGDIASELALTEIRRRIDELPGNLGDEELQERFTLWATEIHRHMVEEGSRDSARYRMGTTLVGLLFYEGRIYVVNIGDSRAYRYSEDGLHRITRDHSLREMTGQRDAPPNIILNSLGAGEQVFADFARVGDSVRAADSYLLSSDGLHDLVMQRDIEKILSTDPESAVQRLVGRAKKRGGFDNITVVLIRIEDPGDETPEDDPEAVVLTGGTDPGSDLLHDLQPLPPPQPAHDPEPPEPGDPSADET